MRLLGAILLLALTSASAQIAKPAALSATTGSPKLVRLTPAAIGDLEKSFDLRLQGMADANEPVEILGDTRGLQLDGYGLVFTTEVSLVRAPSINPFMKEIPKAVQQRVHQLRVERLPILKAAMKVMLHDMATAGVQLPPTQQMVLAVRLWYGTWEDTTGMPRQLIMRANRSDAGAGLVEMEER